SETIKAVSEAKDSSDQSNEGLLLSKEVASLNKLHLDLLFDRSGSIKNPDIQKRLIFFIDSVKTISDILVSDLQKMDH
ncbi:MAG: hypothetical protein KC589_07675, partial [Nanoarchaeota archaeon]|nr:hypothetical protein [Nanoarchaeota archaeon]